MPISVPLSDLPMVRAFSSHSTPPCDSEASKRRGVAVGRGMLSAELLAAEAKRGEAQLGSFMRL